MMNLFERIDSTSAVFNQYKQKENTQEHTELMDRLLQIEHQLLQIEEQKKRTLEVANLKNELIQLYKTCHLKIKTSNLMETFTLKTEATTSTIDASTLNDERFKSFGTSNPFRVFCDQDTDGGGWTVFQRRQDDSEDFYREWLDYKHGFGDLDGEFWLGNKYLSILTSKCCSQLRIDRENTVGEHKYAKYNKFQIKPESEKYSLKVGGYSGNVGYDSLDYHNGQPFSTKDVDNAQSSLHNCPVLLTGAWWYKNCRFANLNGLYRRNQRGDMYWYGFHGHNLTFTEMKFRRLVCE